MKPLLLIPILILLSGCLEDIVEDIPEATVETSIIDSGIAVDSPYISCGDTEIKVTNTGWGNFNVGPGGSMVQAGNITIFCSGDTTVFQSHFGTDKIQRPNNLAGDNVVVFLNNGIMVDRDQSWKIWRRVSDDNNGEGVEIALYTTDFSSYTLIVNALREHLNCLANEDATIVCGVSE